MLHRDMWVWRDNRNRSAGIRPRMERRKRSSIEEELTPPAVCGESTSHCYRKPHTALAYIIITVSISDDLVSFPDAVGPLYWASERAVVDTSQS
jgi:hypothetical protein